MDPDEEWTIPEGGASGLGRSCQEKPLAACVTSCSSRERYPLERDASGELRCPTHAPIVADTCAINCEEIYGRSAWDIDNCWFCEAGSYCVERDDHLLVPTDACAPVPSDCDSSDTQPVCGQDGEHYENKCAMNRARVDSATYRECRDDIEGYYRCGNVYCREGLEYCSVDHSVDDYSTDGFACVMSDCVAAGGCECMGFTAAGAAGAGGGAGGDWIPDNGSEQSCIEEPRRLFIVDG